MRLLISDEIVQEIIDFSKHWAARDPQFADFKISISLPGLSLVFFQPERYDQRIASSVLFRDDVGFPFEDVYNAITGQQISLQANDGGSSNSANILVRNDDYVRRVLEFFSRNMQLLTSVPPPWFEEAVRISDSAIRKIFPDMADDDLRAKRNLWDSWLKKQH